MVFTSFITTVINQNKTCETHQLLLVVDTFTYAFSGISRFSSKWMPIYAYVDAHTCVNWMPSCLAWMLM